MPKTITKIAKRARSSSDETNRPIENCTIADNILHVQRIDAPAHDRRVWEAYELSCFHIEQVGFVVTTNDVNVPIAFVPIRELPPHDPEDEESNFAREYKGGLKRAILIARADRFLERGWSATDLRDGHSRMSLKYLLVPAGKGAKHALGGIVCNPSLARQLAAPEIDPWRRQFCIAKEAIKTAAQASFAVTPRLSQLLDDIEKWERLTQRRIRREQSRLERTQPHSLEGVNRARGNITGPRSAQAENRSV